MKVEWPLQDAKNRLSELVKDALDKGPQTITRRGKPLVVVVSMDEFRRLTARTDTLTAFFRKSPLARVRLDLERDRDTGRDVSL
ncbi:MAG: type II toxin-antitoxin system Phd/YefM family antitoxin [Candidatus Xenobia bacterium]